MSADILEKISVVSFFLATLFIILAIILFFKLRVYALIDDLSGKKAERQIRSYKENNMGLRLGKNESLEYLDYYRQATTNIAESTMKLETTLLDEKTTALMNEETISLDGRNETDNVDYVLVLDEMAVHTEERI